MTIDEQNLVRNIKRSIDDGISTLFKLKNLSEEIKNFYFDFDGTLIDTLWIQQGALKQTYLMLIKLIGEDPNCTRNQNFLKSLTGSDFGSKRIIFILAAMAIEYFGDDQNSHADKFKLLDKSYHVETPDYFQNQILAELELSQYQIMSKVSLNTVASAIWILYEAMYESEVKKIIDNENDFSRFVFSGVSDFLRGCNRNSTAIISGGSLSRVKGVVDRTDLLDFFHDRIYCPTGVTRLIKGAKYKMESIKRLAESCPKKSILFFDDQPHVIKQAMELGVHTVGIIHDRDNVEKMISACPTYIITHDFTSYREWEF